MNYYSTEDMHENYDSSQAGDMPFKLRQKSVRTQSINREVKLTAEKDKSVSNDNLTVMSEGPIYVAKIDLK